MPNTRNNILAFLSGAAIGAGIGLLYAPEKGETTRKIIGEEADKAKDKAKKQWDKSSGEFNESAKKTLADLEKKLDHTVLVAGDKAEEIISSLQKRLDDLRDKSHELHKEGDAAIDKMEKQAKKAAKKSDKKVEEGIDKTQEGLNKAKNKIKDSKK